MSDLHLGWTSNEEDIKRVFKKMKEEEVKDIFYVLNGLGNTAIPFRVGVDTEAYIITIKNKEERKS